MDDNGNPIESNSTISAQLTSDVSAALAWTQINTGDGWGRSYYHLEIRNDISENDDDPKTGWTGIKISWLGENQFGEAIANGQVRILDP